MNLNFGPFIVLETLLAVSVLALFVWRKAVSHGEDDNLHLLHGASVVPQQAVVAHTLDVIDKWGKIMTVATVAFGVVIGAAYAYDNFVKLSNLGS
jgi:hypothetical protein